MGTLIKYNNRNVKGIIINKINKKAHGSVTVVKENKFQIKRLVFNLCIQPSEEHSKMLEK